MAGKPKNPHCKLPPHGTVFLTFDGLRNGTRKKILLARERNRQTDRQTEKEKAKEETIRSVVTSVCSRKIFARRVELKHVGPVIFRVVHAARICERRAMPKARSSSRFGACESARVQLLHSRLCTHAHYLCIHTRVYRVSLRRPSQGP